VKGIPRFGEIGEMCGRGKRGEVVVNESLLLSY